MRWDEKALFYAITSSLERFWGDINAIKLHFCAVVPGCCHHLTEDMLDKNIWLVCCVTRLLEELNDLSTIKSKLQPLQRQAFACALGANQNGEITKIKIDGLEVGEVLDRQRNQAGGRMFVCSLIDRLRVCLAGDAV